MRNSYFVFCVLLFVLMGCDSAETTLATEPAPTVESEVVPVSAEPESPPSTATPIPEDPKSIYEGRVFYEIFVRSFYDSDGDGVGDFNGMTEKLDYLNDGDPNTTDDLGITGIWLMPMMESLSYHGYDTVNYMAVERDYGTKADFQRFLDEAHKRGIIVIVDLVLNHSSSEHPWFVQSSKGPDSPFRDFYVWSDDDPLRDGWHASGDDYYYGIFWEGMPDLNYRNPVVSQAAYTISEFWLEEMGVDGFRLDAIKFLIETDGATESTQETYDWFVDYNAFLKTVNPNAMTVGEIWSGTPEIVKYVETDGVDLAFEFGVAEAILGTARGGAQASGAYEFALESYPDERFATFITNHDQNRVVSSLFNDVERGKLAATILLTSPGVPFVYYGEEIGMEGRKPDPDIRTPMQWSSAEHSGFSSSTPWQPLNDTWSERNVALQTEDDTSILSHYRNLIRLRSDYPMLDDGDYFAVETRSLKLHAHLRQSGDQAILVLANTSREPISDYELGLDVVLDGEWAVSTLMGEASEMASVTGGLGDFRPISELPPLSSHIYLLEK